MKVIVLGSKGMLGSDLLDACRKSKGIQATGYDIDTLDITDAVQVKKLPNADCIVNCAAYTRVDDAESHRDLAYSVNCEGARNVAHLCARRRMKAVYVSTDYVFDGSRRSPYVEQDQTSPLSIYGASKLAGEKAVRGESTPHLVIRTQSLFGTGGGNFVKSIVKKLSSGEEPIRVVNDQTSSPTYTRHLSGAMVRLLQSKALGVVHVTSSGFCSWYEFAQAIAARLKPGTEITPVTTEELNLPAPRPAYSVFETRRYRTITGHVMPTWEQGLDEYLKEEEAQQRADANSAPAR